MDITLENSELVRLQKGDVLVLSVDVGHHPTEKVQGYMDELMKQTRDVLDKAGHEDKPILIVSSKIKISVVRDEAMSFSR